MLPGLKDTLAKCVAKDCYSYNKKFTPELDGHVAGHVAGQHQQRLEQSRSEPEAQVASEEECQKQCFDTVGCGHWAAQHISAPVRVWAACRFASLGDLRCCCGT